MAKIDKQKITQEISNKYSLKDETFGRVVKSYINDKIDVEIGDSKQPDFKPQFKFMRWGNEVNFSIRAEEHPSAKVEIEGEVVKYKTPDHEVHLYDKPQAGEDGGFEFEWFLPKKPRTNVFNTTIQTKGLKFLYQPKLTQEEIDQGMYRPENVVGSYAVYHDGTPTNWKGGIEYKTGKAFHIYRPKVVDSRGKTSWAELNIDPNTETLTVTADQGFLDHALYPVTIDPTFGYTSVGASTVGTGNNDFRGVLHTAPANGTIDSVHLYGTSGSGTWNIKGVMTDSSGNILTNGVGAASSAFPASPTEDWRQSNYSSNPSISNGTDYLIGFVSNNNFDNQRYDTETDVGRYDSSNSYSSPTSPTDASTQSVKASLYATYTGTADVTMDVSDSITITENVTVIINLAIEILINDSPVKIN